jgi:hypothetical protein
VAGLLRLQDADEVVVANPLELADGQASRPLVRLHGDLFDQRLVEVDDVCEFLVREIPSYSDRNSLALGSLARQGPRQAGQLGPAPGRQLSMEGSRI